MAGFLDKVVVGINRGVNSVSEGSKTFVEKAKINTQIQDLEREKNQLLINMGNLVYNLQINGEINIPQCVGICEEITRFNSSIKEQQEKLTAIEAQRGGYYDEYNSAPQSGGVQCQCGFVNKPGAKFCSKCGSPLA